MCSRNIMVTGGAGFIGSHLIRLLVQKYPLYQIINVDKLTYAGNLENLKDIEDYSNYTFERGDILDEEFLKKIFQKYDITDVIHLAAESHVDRSISAPLAFVQTNVLGTVTLLNIAKEYWKGAKSNRFYHVSTDEVYGALGEKGYFLESTAYDPHSPYSASKASADHFVRAYAETYGMNTVISNSSNNYGSHHFPEKLIPLAIHNIRKGIPVPIYGKGENVRDWLWVEDHVRAIDVIFHNSKNGETYNIGGNNEWKNIDLIKLLCNIMDEELGRKKGASEHLITFVEDRAGHDLRYAIDANKLKKELAWEPSVVFEEGLRKTVRWYLQNEDWLSNIGSGNYQNVGR